MSRRTVMTARLATSLRDGPRAVFVCLPETAGPNDSASIATALGRIIRPSDRLLHVGNATSLEPLITFAERHGLFVDPFVADLDAPDLVVVLVDPLSRNLFAPHARALAADRRSDLIIAELPAPSAFNRTTRPPATAVQTRKSAL